MALHKVTLNAGGKYGYVSYDDSTKKIEVHIDEAKEAVQKVEEYLAAPQTMDIPGPKGLREFTTATIIPNADEKSFKLALTRLWVNTQVLVEWSMPPELAEKL